MCLFFTFVRNAKRKRLKVSSNSSKGCAKHIQVSPNDCCMDGKSETTSKSSCKNLMLRSQYSTWPQQSSLPNDCHEFKQARITRGAQPWRSHCSERSWRYTSRAYNRWLSWLHRHKNAGVSLPFVCIRCIDVKELQLLRVVQPVS